MHPNVTVQYFKSIPFVHKAWKTCDHTSVSDKNQSSSQSKGFIHGLVQKILVTCERVANKFSHPGANYTYDNIIYIPSVNQRMWTGLKSINICIIFSALRIYYTGGSNSSETSRISSQI